MDEEAAIENLKKFKRHITKTLSWASPPASAKASINSKNSCEMPSKKKKEKRRLP